MVHESTNKQGNKDFCRLSLLKKGTVLDAASIGFLAGLGIPKVNVYKIPKVAILVTGNELQQLGNILKEGQVYESNSITLKLALKKIGVKNIKIRY